MINSQTTPVQQLKKTLTNAPPPLGERHTYSSVEKRYFIHRTATNESSQKCTIEYKQYQYCTYWIEVRIRGNKKKNLRDFAILFRININPSAKDQSIIKASQKRPSILLKMATESQKRLGQGIDLHSPPCPSIARYSIFRNGLCGAAAPWCIYKIIKARPP
jgi:hypothetical protein